MGRCSLRRALASTLVVGSLGLLLVVSAGAVPKPPPKYWGTTRCEHVLLDVYGYGSHFAPGGFPLPTGDGHGFHLAQATCIGSDRPQYCRWAASHRGRLYSEFTVLARSPLNGGVVRSFTLATRAGPGLVKIVHHFGDRYVGWPADFYISSTRLLATDVSPTGFRSLVEPLAARVVDSVHAVNCTGR